MSRIELASLGPGVAQNSSGAVAAFAAGSLLFQSDGTPVPIWTARTGGTQSTSGLFTTDAFGRIPGWVDRQTADVEMVITIRPADPVTVVIPGTSPGGGGGVSIPLILDAASGAVLEIGVTAAAHQSIIWDADGSAHFSDTANAAKVQLVVDEVNNGNDGLGLYPDGGGTSAQLSLYGGDLNPHTGTGTSAGQIWMHADPIGSEVALFQDWFASGGRQLRIATNFVNGAGHPMPGLSMAAEGSLTGDGPPVMLYVLSDGETNFGGNGRISALLKLQGDTSFDTSVAGLDPGWGGGTTAIIVQDQGANNVLAIDYAGALQWEQFRMAPDINISTSALGIWPTGTGPAHATAYFSLYGGDVRPGGGTHGGWLNWEATTGQALMQVTGDYETNGTGFLLEVTRPVDNSSAESFLIFDNPYGLSGTRAHAKLGISSQLSPAFGHLDLQADAGYAAPQSALVAAVGGSPTFRINYNGAFGAFGHTPPTAQPATPASLADVTAILQSYGMCA